MTTLNQRWLIGALCWLCAGQWAVAGELPGFLSERLTPAQSRLLAVACALDNARVGTLREVGDLLRADTDPTRLIRNLSRLRPAIGRSRARQELLVPRGRSTAMRTQRSPPRPAKVQTAGVRASYSLDNLVWLTSTTNQSAKEDLVHTQRVWFEAGIESSEQDAAHDFDAFDADSNSLTLGWDWDRDNFWLSASIDQLSADVDSAALGEDQIDAIAITGTAGISQGQQQWTASIAYTSSETDRVRVIGLETLAATRTFALRADIDSTQWAADLNWGRYFAINDNWMVTPNIGLSISQQQTDDYAEVGAGNLSLDVTTDDNEQLVGYLGLNISYLGFAGDWLFSPSLQLGFEHDFEAQAMSSFAQFRDTRFGFGTQGFSIEENRWRFGLTLQAEHHSGFGVSVGVESHTKDDYRSLSALLSLSNRF